MSLFTNNEILKIRAGCVMQSQRELLFIFQKYKIEGMVIYGTCLYRQETCIILSTDKKVFSTIYMRLLNNILFYHSIFFFFFYNRVAKKKDSTQPQQQNFIFLLSFRILIIAHKLINTYSIPNIDSITQRQRS